MFYLLVEIFHRGCLVLTAVFCKLLHLRFIDIPSTDRRVTFALSSNYQRLPLKITFRRTDWSFVTKSFVGRTILIKLKILSFPYKLIISTQIFKVIIILRQNLSLFDYSLILSVASYAIMLYSHCSMCRCITPVQNVTFFQ